MEYRSLGSTGLVVSEISLGSWLTFGSSVDREGTRKLVQRAFDCGINFFDTADVYSNGAGEEALGYALQGIPRPYTVIASKCFFPMSKHPNDRGLSRKHIFESAEASLRRLGTDYLDLLQCHRPDPRTPIEETVCAFEDLIRQGKILYWGVSEWPALAIEDACRSAALRRAYRPISNQPQYSILRRAIEQEILPTCEREGLGQLVFSPLAQGTLTGKYRGREHPDDSRGADPQRNVFMSAFLEPSALQRIESLRPLAADCGLSMAQLALAWCLRQPGVSSVIVGATRADQLDDNVGASGAALPPEVVERIDALFPAS